MSVAAYVLAGGRSSRMGTDKALLELAGKLLIEHAVTKLRRIATDVRILSSNPALARYAPLVEDLHPDTGPIGGIEAALAHTSHDWNLILPVDVPFLPTLFLARWVEKTAQGRVPPVALFRVDGRPQPTLLLIHRDAASYLTLAIERGEYKLLAALETAARELGGADARIVERVPSVLSVGESAPSNPQPWQLLTAAQRAAQPIWFANLNTPEEFAEAERHAEALDT